MNLKYLVTIFFLKILFYFNNVLSVTSSEKNVINMHNKNHYASHQGEGVKYKYMTQITTT